MEGATILVVAFEIALAGSWLGTMEVCTWVPPKGNRRRGQRQVRGWKGNVGKSGRGRMEDDGEGRESCPFAHCPLILHGTPTGDRGFS